MLVTIQLAMPTTLLFHVYPEGTVQQQKTYSCSPCVYNYCSTKKVVGISTISRLEHASAQTREVQCTRQVLPEVIKRGEYVIILYLCTCTILQHYTY